MQVAIYVRVSTQEQKRHGISVSAQEAACRRWVQAQGHTLVGVYNDAGLSARAKYSRRRAMLQLLEDIQVGKVELIVFTKLDRWFRNVGDYYQVQAILERHGVLWRAIEEDYETQTASGRFKVNIMLAVAQDEADRTAERIRCAADYKRSKGEAIGRAPVGYCIREKHFVLDPETAPAIRAFFRAYLSSYRLKDAQEAALAQGLCLSAARARRTLRNATYCGDHFGVPCPAYITPEEFSEIRKVVESRTRQGKAHLVYLFAGLLRCGLCGGRLTSAAPFQRDHVRRIKTYRCGLHAQYLDRCPGTYVNEKKLEGWLLEALEPLLADYDVQFRVLRATVRDAGAQRRRLEGKRSRLRELYVEGELSKVEYDAQARPLKEALARLQAQTAMPDTLPPMPEENWRAVYAALSEPGRKRFWQRALAQVTVYRDGPPRVEFSPAAVSICVPSRTAKTE